MSAVVGCAAPSTRRAVGSISSSIADFVLEGPAAIGLKRTDPEGVPQRMYTSDPTEYESASGAEEHEEAADAAASTHST